MSERFPNKVLKQAYEAFDDAYNEVYWGTTTPTVEVVAAAQAAGFAAMRAVLEGRRRGRRAVSEQEKEARIARLEELARCQSVLMAQLVWGKHGITNAYSEEYQAVVDCANTPATHPTGAALDVPQSTIRALREIAEKRKKDDGDE